VVRNMLGANFRRTTAFVVSLVLMTFGWLAVSERPAEARTGCPNPNTGYLVYGGQWQPDDNHVWGERAPIQQRINGVPCDPSGTGFRYGALSMWLGIQSGTTNSPGDKLVQVGHDKVYDSVFDSVTTCRWYQIVTGGVHDTGGPVRDPCPAMADDDFFYYRIVKYNDNGTNRYRISSCGFSNPTYSNCTTLDNGTPVFSTDYAIGAAESIVDTCATVMFGSPGDPDDIGGPVYPAQIQGESSNPWDAKNYNGLPQGPGLQSCSHYQKSTATTGQVNIWDDRN
jgi:hypothetical protein